MKLRLILRDQLRTSGQLEPGSSLNLQNLAIIAYQLVQTVEELERDMAELKKRLG